MGEQRRTKPSPAEILAATRRQIGPQEPGSKREVKRGVVEPLEKWLKEHRDAKRPSMEEAVQIVSELLPRRKLEKLRPANKDFLLSRWAEIKERFPHRVDEALLN
ncbi:MAG: hypothetical protein OXG37_01380 [Actinomycetia bacterium]|nr:hypothetical protein [Actinomycetes bacterium]